MLPELYYCEEIIVQLRAGINMLNKKLNIVNMTILFIYSFFLLWGNTIVLWEAV